MNKDKIGLFIKIDREIHKQLKLKAVKENQSLTSIIISLIKKYLLEKDK